MFKVLYATSEAFPYAQTGGLGEVSGSLPKSLTKLGCEVRLVMPAYGTLKAAHPELVACGPLVVPGYPERAALLRPRLADADGTDAMFIDQPELFDRSGELYTDSAGSDWPDNPYRYAFFSHALAALALGAMPDSWVPDVVHCHDWQTALVPALLALHGRRPATIFTIHNLAFQGLCDRATFAHLRLPERFWDLEALEFHGQCALIKGGLVFADRLTTVSPTYAREIQHPAYGCGLDGLLRKRAAVLSGILNGIDYALWDPARDPHLSAHYDARRLSAGKRANKRRLQRTFGLPEDDSQFLLGTVSRLAAQKGIDLILEALPELSREPLQCLFLGSGDPGLTAAIRTLAESEPHRYACRFGYDPTISHRMFAGLDAFLMPSRFEPCGLSQLYSQRYGTVPIVRRTGGLADSVIDPADASYAPATGFIFYRPKSAALAASIARAHAAYRDRQQWRQLQRNGMNADYSWERSASAYVAVYRAAIAGR